MSCSLPRIAIAAMLSLPVCLSAQAATMPAPGGGDASAGAVIFNTRCTACHSTTPTRKPGPLLTGVVGRAAGSMPGYAYSPALKGAGITWTPENLDQWLSGPERFIPGVNMSATVVDATQRRDLIAYLKTLAAPPAGTSP